MFAKLFILFAIVPFAEIALLIQIGTIIGTFNTILIVMATAFGGAWLVRLEGMGVAISLRQSMLEGRFPAEELLDGAMILSAGLLLLTPGIITDIVGFALVIRPSRALIKIYVKRFIEERISSIDIRIDRF